MTDFELESKRAIRIFDMLKLGSNSSIIKEIYINIYLNENKEYRYSVRLNEVNNRINNLTFKTLAFFLREFKLSNHEVKKIRWFKMSLPFYQYMNGFLHDFKYVSEESLEPTQAKYIEKIKELESEVIMYQIRRKE